MEWSRRCNTQVSDVEGCSATDMAEAMARAFRGHSPRNLHGTTHTVIKVQYDHIPEERMGDFAQFCSCNQVAVVHLVRLSVLEMFWTVQAQVMDVAQYHGELRYPGPRAVPLPACPWFIFSHSCPSETGGPPAGCRDRMGSNQEAAQLLSNQRALTLPVTETVAYVKALESRREGFRTLLHLHPETIAYFEVFYEDLRRAQGPQYFIALQAWLGVAKPVALQGAGLVRVHPGRCTAKIANYAQVRRACVMAGLHTAVRACELP